MTRSFELIQIDTSQLWWSLSNSHPSTSWLGDYRWWCSDWLLNKHPHTHTHIYRVLWVHLLFAFPIIKQSVGHSGIKLSCHLIQYP